LFSFGGACLRGIQLIKKTKRNHVMVWLGGTYRHEEINKEFGSVKAVLE
jgi:hypothetical protein